MSLEKFLTCALQLLELEINNNYQLDINDIPDSAKGKLHFLI